MLSLALKILGKVSAADDPFSEKTEALISWALTVARCAIFKSANYHRLNNSCVPPEAIFKESIKAQLEYQSSLYSSRNLSHLFPTDWCIKDAFAKVETSA